MSRQLCEVCLKPPDGTDKGQPYSIGIPEGITLANAGTYRIEHAFCVDCFLAVVEQVDRIATTVGCADVAVLRAIRIVTGRRRLVKCPGRCGQMIPIGLGHACP